MSQSAPDAWCRICGGAGRLQGVRYRWSFDDTVTLVPIGEIQCRTCDGSGISVRAAAYRRERAAVVESGS